MTRGDASRARPSPRPTHRRCRRGSIARGRAAASTSGRARTEGDLVIDRPLRLVGHGPAAAPRLRARQRRPRARRRRARRGLRHRRPRGRRPRARLLGHPRRRAARDRSATAASRNRSSASTCAKPTARSSSAATIRGIPGRDPGEQGSGIHVWNTERLHARRDNDVADVARRLLHPVVVARPHRAQRRRATCATACTTCSRTTTSSRTTSSSAARPARR